jgi:hypothetical protein
MTAAVGIAQSGTNNVSWRNRIINGAMVIDQRNAGASVTPANGAFTYVVDRWNYYVSQASKLTSQQSSTAPTGFINSLLTTSSSAYSVLSTDAFVLIQFIEGLNVADLGWGTASAQTVTLSFQVRSSLTGTFGGSVTNSAQNRSYPFTYTISAANTWEQKTVTIAGDTTGTWLTTNGKGLALWFGLGVGSNSSGTAGAWAGANYLSATGATSVVGTNGATFYITGVQLERGTSATPFEYRDYGRELIMCQRYYYRLKSEATGTRMGSLFCDSTTVATALVSFPTSMRTRPLSLEQSGTAADYMVIAGAANPACNSVPAFGISTIDCASVNLTVASGLTTGFGGQIRAANANAFLAWSAEL